MSDNTISPQKTGEKECKNCKCGGNCHRSPSAESGEGPFASLPSTTGIQKTIERAKTHALRVKADE